MNFFKILAGFLPFVAFGVLAPHLGAAVAAGVGVGVSIVVIAATARSGVNSVLVVQGITLLAMAAVATAGGHGVGTGVVRYGPAIAALVLGGFMLATASRWPFTAQSSRQSVPPTFWHHPLFIQTNRKISIAWGLATVFLGACHLISTFVPSGLVQIVLMWVLPVATMYLAVIYTRRTVHEAAAQRSKLAASMAATHSDGAVAK